MCMRTCLVGLLAALLALIPFGPASVHAANAVMVGSCDERTLLAAISSAGAGGAVTFSCSGTITVTATIVIGQELTLDGSGQAVTISGGHSVEVFVVNSGGSLTLSHLTIADGSAGDGGGIFNSGTLRVTNSTFTGNSAGSGIGGAIVNSVSGMVSVAGSTFSGNSAAAGGGIDNPAGTVSVTNSTFTGNSASGGGGGGISNSGTLSVTNSTFSGNGGTGFHRGGGLWNGGTARLANTILANSFAGGACLNNAGATLVDAGGNVEDGTTCGFGASSLSSTNPQLLPPAANGGPTQTMALAPTSPAIGAGLAATCLSTAPASPVNDLDQRGQPRHADVRARCDSGAYDTGGAVSDTSPPVLSLPATITADATSPAGAVVTYAVSASDPDNAAGQITLACTPASGSTFPIGATTVNCSASDPVGNAAAGSFQVIVRGAAAQLGDLTGMIESLALPHGLGTSLESKLRDSLAAVQGGATAPACSDLTALGNEVRAQAGKKLTAAQGRQLLNAAAQIQAVLGC